MYDNCFFMCMENQNIFEVARVCTGQTQEWCDSTADVRALSYPAEQVRASWEKLEDEAERQLVQKMDKILVYV